MQIQTPNEDVGWQGGTWEMNGQGRALIFFWIIISTWRAGVVVGGNEGVKRRRRRGGGGGNAANIFSIRSKFIFRGVINNRLYFLVRNILNANVKNVQNDHSVTRLTTYIWYMKYELRVWQGCRNVKIFGGNMI